MSAEPLEARTMERFCELCERAQQYGLHVCLEFAIYTGVRTLADAARLVKKSGSANASVLVDALHFSRSGGLPVRHRGHRCVALQVCADLRRRGRHPDRAADLIREARTGRLLPGEGALPLRDLVAALPAAIPLAIEAPVRATAGLPALERAQRAYRSMHALLG